MNAFALAALLAGACAAQTPTLETIAKTDSAVQGAAFDGAHAAPALAAPSPAGPRRQAPRLSLAQKRRDFDIARPSVARGLALAGMTGATASRIGEDDNLAPQYLVAGGAFATGLTLLTAGRPSTLRRVVGGVLVASALASALDEDAARAVAYGGLAYGLGEAGGVFFNR